MIVKLRRLYANCVSCFVLKIWLNALCSAFKTAIHCASLRLRNNSTTNEKIRQKRWTKRERKLTLSFFHSFAVFYFPLSQEQDCFKPRCTAVPLSIRMGWMGFQNSKRELKSQTCARSQKGDEQFTSFEHMCTLLTKWRGRRNVVVFSHSVWLILTLQLPMYTNRPEKDEWRCDRRTMRTLHTPAFSLQMDWAMWFIMARV